jgi:hypothetical protein
MMVVTGGYTEDRGFYNGTDMFCTGYLPDINTWVLFNLTTTENPGNRIYHGSTWYNGKIYVFGGDTDGVNPQNDVSFLY